MKRKPIYVEVPIYANIEAIWDASQKPEMHEQWRSPVLIYHLFAKKRRR